LGGQEAVLVDVASREARTTLRGHRARITAFAWSPDGRRVATGASDDTVIVWGAMTGARLQSLETPAAIPWVTHRHWAIAWAPDGTSLATALSGSGMVRLWNVEDGRLQALVSTGTSGVDTLAWSPRGDVLTIAANDHTLHLWHRPMRRRRAILRGHTGMVTALRWSPDGRRLASGALDGSVRLWDAGTRRELAAFYAFDEGKQWLTVTPDGYFAASARGAEVLRYRLGAMLRPGTKLRRRFERPDLVRKALTGQPPNSRRSEPHY
jgi:WD40 repeat protein